MIVITGKLDELFVRWSTQTLPPPPPLANFDRCSPHSGLKQETKTKIKSSAKGDFISEGTFPLVSSSKQYLKVFSL